MEEIISLKNIQIHQKAESWQQAIEVAGGLLVENGSIKQGYIDGMIKAVEELGPYIVLMEHFALAHAAPCEDVLKDDLSITVFDNDIVFGSDNDPVRVVMCLASSDGESHVARLSVIAEKLLESEGEIINALINASSEEEIYQLING